MAKYAFAEPATSAPQAALDYAAAMPTLPTKAYAATKDHDYEYPAGTYVDHTTPEAAKAAFDVLALMPRVTKKEAQFALGFQTPKQVTLAANRYAKPTADRETPLVAHQVVRPAPFRPLAPEYRPTKAAEAPAPAAPEAPAPEAPKARSRRRKAAAA